MKIKRFYGENIREAREEAKAMLGEDMIVLESRAPKGGSPACITLMAKKGAELKKAAAEEPVSYSREAIREKVAVFADLMAESKETSGYSSSPSEMTAFESQDESLNATGSNEDEPQLKRRNISLMPESLRKNEVVPSAGTATDQPEISAGQLQKLIQSYFIQANAELISLPVYQQLLQAGIPAGYVNRWLNETISMGVDPFANRREFLLQLGSVIRKHLPNDSSISVKRIQVFVGPSAAGCTSLITKLSRNKHLLAGNKLAVICLMNEGDRPGNRRMQELAEEHKFEYFEVESAQELAELNMQLKHFDNLLIDTPAISLLPEKAVAQIRVLQDKLQYLPDFELHYVLNATLNSCYFSEAYLSRFPLKPDFLALTHMDEALSWGHFLPFVEIGGASMRYISEGAGAFDEIRTYSKAWFTEKILTPNQKEG
jgi:flagellar biosynthesis protein FlhF